MSELPSSKDYAARVVLLVGGLLAVPLWREFHEAGALAWNLFLAGFLITLVARAFFGVRYPQRDHVEVGEARFTSGR